MLATVPMLTLEPKAEGRTAFRRWCFKLAVSICSVSGCSCTPRTLTCLLLVLGCLCPAWATTMLVYPWPPTRAMIIEITRSVTLTRSHLTSRLRLRPVTASSCPSAASRLAVRTARMVARACSPSRQVGPANLHPLPSASAPPKWVRAFPFARAKAPD